IVGLVGEAVRAVVVGGWRVRERAVGIERHRAVLRGVDQNRSQRIAVDVGVVGQHTAGRNDERRVFIGGVAVVDGRGRVVDRVDRDRHGGDVAVGRSVVGLVGKAIRAVVIGGWRVGERAVGIERYRAVLRGIDQD